MAEISALKRGIRFRDLTLFYVAGSLSIRWAATAAAGGPSSLVIWIAALLCFFIPLAGSVMELSRATRQKADSTFGHSAPLEMVPAFWRRGPTG